MTHPITEEILRERLAKKVRAIRKKRGLTVKGAAVRGEIHWRHWQKVEAAHVNATLLTLVRIADALDIDPMELMRAE